MSYSNSMTLAETKDRNLQPWKSQNSKMQGITTVVLCEMVRFDEFFCEKSQLSRSQCVLYVAQALALHSLNSHLRYTPKLRRPESFK